METMGPKTSPFSKQERPFVFVEPSQHCQQCCSSTWQQSSVLHLPTSDKYWHKCWLNIFHNQDKLKHIGELQQHYMCKVYIAQEYSHSQEADLSFEQSFTYDCTLLYFCNPSFQAQVGYFLNVSKTNGSIMSIDFTQKKNQTHKTKQNKQLWSQVNTTYLLVLE